MITVYSIVIGNSGVIPDYLISFPLVKYEELEPIDQLYFTIDKEYAAVLKIAGHNVRQWDWQRMMKIGKWCADKTL